jgi:hypothetical protein
MNPPGAGGALPAFLPMAPIWYPPVSSKWIFTALILFAGAVAPRFNAKVRSIFLNPVGFFVTLLVAIGAFQNGFPPATFAILFFLLSLWVTQKTEGFACRGLGSLDTVVNRKLWWVEKVMNERPIGIQEKDVQTFPVSD